MDPEHLEARLRGDLHELDPGRFADERFCGDLYRALAGRRWTKEGEAGAVSLSRRRASELVDELRDVVAGVGPLDLASSGGEGELGSTVEGELRDLGWTSKPALLDQHDPDRVDEPAKEPPGDQGDRFARQGVQDERLRTHAAGDVDRAP